MNITKEIFEIRSNFGVMFYSFYS